jgi:orotate phosphoribosyltransferase
MTNINDYATQAMDMKKKGLSDKEIADELHISLDTVAWLLVKSDGKKKGGSLPAADIRVGWRSIGVYPHRMRMVGSIMADMAVEELGDKMADTVVGIAINGIALANFVAEALELELAVYRNLHDDKAQGTISSNFAGLKGKKAILVDDVFGTGDTVRGAIKTLREEGADPVLVIVLLNKTGLEEIDDVRLRSLVRAHTIG